MKKITIMLVILMLVFFNFGNSNSMPKIKKTKAEKQEAKQIKKEEKQAKTIIRLQKVEEKKIAREIKKSPKIAVITPKNNTSKPITPSITPKIITPNIAQVPKKIEIPVTYSAASSISNVDIDQVRSEWLKWYNDIRAKE